MKSNMSFYKGMLDIFAPTLVFLLILNCSSYIFDPSLVTNLTLSLLVFTYLGTTTLISLIIVEHYKLKVHTCENGLKNISDVED